MSRGDATASSQAEVVTAVGFMRVCYRYSDFVELSEFPTQTIINT